MIIPQKLHASSVAFTYYALYWIVFAALTFTSALMDMFWPPFFAFYLLGGIFLLFSKHTHKLRDALTPLTPLISITLAVVTVWSFFVTPTVFTGRDQGSIATAAMMLADTHRIAVHTPASDTFFAYYGEGRALNFPGFFYTADGALTPQFPLPTITYLAAFYSIFGLSGFILANIILFVFFAISLTLLAQHIATFYAPEGFEYRKTSYYALFFLLTNFSFMWFFKHTLSENLAQFLIFFMLLQALLFIKGIVAKARTRIIHLHFWSTLLTGTLLTFTRIEGALLFGLTLLAFLIHPRTNIYLRTRIISHLLMPTLALLFAFAFVFHKTINFYKTVAKALLPSTHTDADATTAPSAFSFIHDMLMRHIEYISYGIAPFIVVGLCGAFLLWKRRLYVPLIPLFVTAPLFVYLIDPHISADAPWMLRRMAFALLPIGILYSAVFLALVHKRAIAYGTLFILTACALPAYLTFLTYSENYGLLAQTHALAEQFAQSDLILIDAESSGNNFAMLAGPFYTLHKKNAAYIFNPEDLKRVDMSAFSNVFLIVPLDKAHRYIDALDARLLLRTKRTITTTRLTQPHHTRLWHFPSRDTVTTDIGIYELIRS